MPVSHTKNLLLPVETANRELDAKLLLALFAAEAGFTSHIGVMSHIQAPGFSPSIYISKSVRFAKQLRLMRDFGHTIVSWDEEGLARYTDAGHSSRIEPEAFHLPELLFSWGESNSVLWKNHPAYRGTPILNTGNPRIDLLRAETRPMFASEIARLQANHGNFVLLNSNFGLVNHFKAGGRKPKISRNSHDAQGFLDFQEGVRGHKRVLLEHFLKAIPVFARCIAPNILVIRPHPSEGHEIWQKAAQGLSNVRVIHEGPVGPWLMAARCLIHNGCTSAVEGVVTGLTALAYRPVTDDTYDIPLPNQLSENFTSAEALAERAMELVIAPTRQGPSAETLTLLHGHIASLEGSFSCERIVDALKALVAQGLQSPVAAHRRLAAHVRHALRKTAKRFSRESLRYEKHKTDAGIFTAAGIAERARPMQAALNRFSGVRFATRSAGVVTISPAT